MAQLKDFWDWFNEYHEALYFLQDFPEHEQAYYYNELTSRLKDIHPDLSFEIGFATDGGEARFTLTANGQAEGMMYVSQLVSLVSKIPKWQVSAFIQPKLSIEDIKQGVEEPYKFQEFHLKPSHIIWSPVDMNPDTYKYEFLFHFKGLAYRDLDLSYEKIIDYLTIILLDLLGERVVSQQIQMIYYDDIYMDRSDWYRLDQLPEFLKEGFLE
jgi:hypothetical protein